MTDTDHDNQDEGPAGITIRIEGDFDLYLSDVFPDGAPDGWTAADVVAAIKSVGRRPEDLIHDWDLQPTVHVDIWRPGQTTETAEVWE